MRILILLLIISSCINLKGQIVHPKENTDSTNVYFICLKKHVDCLKDSGTLYVEEILSITEDLPLRINNFNIKYLSKEKILDITSKGKAIYLISIRPIQCNKNGFTVFINDYYIFSKRRKLNFGYSGGSSFSINLTCDSKIYLVEMIKHGGI
jgi:hypothetical protein